MTKKIVYVQGSWDLFHVGHLNLLQRAKKIAKKLIVGVNIDKSIKGHKGYYPIISFHDRVKILKACKYVDKVIKSDLTFNIRQLKRHRIEVIVLGSDWEGKCVDGQTTAEMAGIKIVYFSYTKGISSTEIKEKIKKGE